MTETKGRQERRARPARRGERSQIGCARGALRGAGPRKRLPLQRAHDLYQYEAVKAGCRSCRKDDAKTALGAAVLPTPFRGFLQAASCPADRKAPFFRTNAEPFAACAIFMVEHADAAGDATDRFYAEPHRLSYLKLEPHRAALRSLLERQKEDRCKDERRYSDGKPPLRAGQRQISSSAPYQYARRQEMVTRDCRRAAQKRSSTLSSACSIGRIGAGIPKRWSSLPPPQPCSSPTMILCQLTVLERLF